MNELEFLSRLGALIDERRDAPPEGSYTATLFAAGRQRIAQKVGEEAVETALAAVAGEKQDVIDESADLLYHLLVLLSERGLTLTEVVAELRQRHGN